MELSTNEILNKMLRENQELKMVMGNDEERDFFERIEKQFGKMEADRLEEIKRMLEERGIRVVVVSDTNVVKPKEPADGCFDVINYLGKDEQKPTIQERVFGYASGQDKRRERRAKARIAKKKR